jgi:hypothetical protein
MSPRTTFRIRDVGAYLGVSHQRAQQMFHEGKFPSLNGLTASARSGIRRRSNV